MYVFILTLSSLGSLDLRSSSRLFAASVAALSSVRALSILSLVSSNQLSVIPGLAACREVTLTLSVMPLATGGALSGVVRGEGWCVPETLSPIYATPLIPLKWREGPVRDTIVAESSHRDECCAFSPSCGGNFLSSCSCSLSSCSKAG